MKVRLIVAGLLVLAVWSVSQAQDMKKDVIVYRVTNYGEGKETGHVYHFDFANCQVLEPDIKAGSPMEMVKQEVNLCNKGKRVQFIVTHANGYVLHYDWILDDGGRIVKGAYRDSYVKWGPSIGKAESSYNVAKPPGGISLQGRWVGYRNGSKVADCSIVQQGNALTFIIHRSPEERSKGRWNSSSMVQALDWGKNVMGKVSPDGKRIDWPVSNSYWLKVDDTAAPPPPPPPPTTQTHMPLQGKWIGYRAGNKVADCSIIQQGDALTFIIHRSPEDRSSGKWNSANEVQAIDWGKDVIGKVSADGKRIDWPISNSYWLKVE